jgi:DNA-binding NtrC family response regulator
MMERAVLLAKGNQIEPVDLAVSSGGPVAEGEPANVAWSVPPHMTLEEMEKSLIESTLKRTGGNKQAAANLLGIYRPRLYSKIRRYNIDTGGLRGA